MIAVKELHKFTCQICGTQIKGPAGCYAEAAHIRPLGKPHNGPDSIDNLLWLCPNHHVMFDLGIITVNDDLTLVGIEGKLSVSPKHQINHEQLRYHRDHYGTK